MINKNFFLGAALFFFCMSVGVAWYGGMSVTKQAAMVTMRARFKAAEEALSADRRQAAALAYRAATVDYQKGIAKSGYYIGIGDDLLTAGNGFWQQGQFRAALAAYRRGLKEDPYSINLLTSAGFCALRLGESGLAADFLKQSQKIYPVDKRVNKALRKLQSRGQKKDSQ